MATIRRLKNKKYVAEVRKYGHYKSKTFTTKVEANRWAVETEQFLSPEQYIQGKLLGDAFARYRDEISPTMKGYKNERNRLNVYIKEPFAKLPLLEIKQLVFAQWVIESAKRIKTSSVNRDLALLSSVFEQAKRWRWTDNNPIRGIKRLKNPPPRDRRISPKEIKQVLKALFFDGDVVSELRHQVAVAFLFALETAMRQGEIWGLEWKRVFLNKQYLTLEETKSGTKRDVPLSKEAVRLLKLLKPNQMGKVFNSNQGSCATIFRRAVKH